ncbi:MAG: RdgB/HAM1 family non-canonical purine NTP pyrophosphatase [Pirellulales bacterium]|nr:RdgB/HAM1 family non-canonical purine NTP pyrophosphatase [Pirellulales bacterium]|tara:strand:- start:247 stop:852 length:606 start_codon:yes stop_codon:yes gene_type:complete
MLLVLGTHNAKKRIELEELLAPHGFELKTLADFEDAIEVEETGTTFQQNAGLKASEQAVNLGHWVMGEDSGISVVALEGRPGVYSARYSGEGATDEKNNEKLLSELDGIPLEKRTAYYTCHMAISDPQGNIVISCEARCYGRILFKEDGKNGFGYDPLFEIPEYHQTFGQLNPAVKRTLSHRSRAMRQILPKLLELKRKHS